MYPIPPIAPWEFLHPPGYAEAVKEVVFFSSYFPKNLYKIFLQLNHRRLEGEGFSML